MYLHELGDQAASFTKEEMQQGKHQEYEKRLHEILLGSSDKNKDNRFVLRSFIFIQLSFACH